jgi:hypothetical protein
MRKIIVLLLVLLYFNGFSQKNKKPEKPEKITYTGIVYDINHEPLPFVNVFMAKGKFGTTTDINGEFVLKTRRKRGKMTFSLMGYQTKVVKVSPKNTFIKVILKEEKNVLDEVVIVQRPKKRLKKKENPAYRILKQIWKHRKKNGLKQVDKYEYRKYETTEIGLNHLDTVFLKKIFKKDYRRIIEELPFDNEGFHYYIPVYIKELVYHIYGNNRLNKERIDIEAEKSNGFYQQGFVFDRMANKFDEVDIYKNTFNLFNKPFVSPISTTGFDTYDYLLYDSIQKNNQKFYNIYFFPRREGDLAFEGNFLVTDKNFSVTKITMKLKKDVNVNFVRGVYVEKEYTIVNDSIYLPKTDVFEGDFTLIDKNDKNKGLNIKKTYHYSDYNFNKSYSPDFYDEQIEQYAPNQFKKDKKYWKNYTDLTQSEKTYRLINEVKHKKRIVNITKWINIVTTGYFDLGRHFQFGPIFKAFGKNGVEGLRLAAGFRTFKTSDDRFRLIGHLAYGLKDEKIKYGFQAKYLLSYKPRIELNLTVSDDYTQQARTLLNVSNIMFTENFGSNFVLSRGKNYFLSRIREKSIKLDYRIAKNFHLGLIPAYKTIEPADRKYFSMDYIDQKGMVQKRVVDVGSDFYLTYTPGRDVYGFGVEQRYGKNPFPSFIINYHHGFKSLGGDFSYDKLQFRYMQRVLLGKIGKTDLTVELGKTFGTVPLALLNPVPANQILLLKPNTFTLLNYYDFVTDTYAVGHFEHHFSGFIWNRLPLLRKLKFRVVTSFRAAYGTISTDNISINRSNLQYAAPDKDLYYEYSVGLENIGYGNLRFIRVDAVWRSDYQSVNGLYSPKFAIRVGIRPDF